MISIRTFVISFAIVAFLGVALHLPAAESDASKSAENYQKIKEQWDAQLKQIAEAQVKLTGAPPIDQFAQMQKYAVLVNQERNLVPKLQAAAEEAYAADKNRGEIGDLLYQMAMAHLRSDRYEEALQVCDFLIAHQYPQKDVYRIAASAAFAAMHLAEAKKYLEALGGGKLQPDSATIQLVAEIDRYQQLWKSEQKLREAEAKADDLPRVKLHTSRGDIVLELFENEAPNTVANFISLVDKGFYNGTQFHRVLPSFMAQGGDPLSKEPLKNKGKVGTGGPGYTIADECKQPNHRLHFRGSLSMAHAGPDTGGSQFFLAFTPLSQLDGVHTVFGRIIDGIDVLSKLQRIDPEHPMPLTLPDTIIKAEVLRKRDHPYEPKTTPKSEVQSAK